MTGPVTPVPVIPGGSESFSITTIAGTGEGSFGGDGGPAVEAQLNLPYDVAVDGAGNLYIADWTITTASARWIRRGRSPPSRGRECPASAGTEARRPQRDCTTPMAWRWTGRATSTSPMTIASASARWIRRGRSRRLRGPDITASVGTGGRRSRRISRAPVEWRWTGRATSTSPIAQTTAFAKSIPRGPSPRLRGRESAASAGTEDRRSRPTPPMEWRWTGRATSTSPIPSTIASARWIRRGPSPRSRGPESKGSAGTGVRRPQRNWSTPMAWRWTGRATSTSPIITASARWIRRGRSPPIAGTGGGPASAGTEDRRVRRNWPAPVAWRWTGRATSTSPILATTASAS